MAKGKRTASASKSQHVVMPKRVRKPLGQLAQDVNDSIVVNNAGGSGTFAVDDMIRAHRFLILGTEGGTYYTGERKLGMENASAIARLLESARSKELVDLIVDISVKGRAAKQGPTLFAFAMAARLGDLETRRYVYSKLTEVCRIPTHLFMFIGFVEEMKDGTGWGRLQRRAIAAFYNDKDAVRLAHMITKYKNREGWCHRDVLRLAHVKPKDSSHDVVLRYAVVGELDEKMQTVVEQDEEEIAGKAFSVLAAVQEAKTCEIPRLLELVRTMGLVREHIPSQHLNNTLVWEALLEKMPLTAMIRNLSKMTAIGLLAPLTDAVDLVCKKLADKDMLNRARVHPFSVLLAATQYKAGRGDKGSLTWNAVPQIVAALDKAFYDSFGTIEATNKRFVIALDVSGSMGGGRINGANCMTPRVASAAMAMVAMRTEPKCHPLAFHTGIQPLKINASMDLDTVINTTSRLPFGGTDCAQPMIWAKMNGVKADMFVVYTDCETWAGSVTPAQALRDYRRATGIPARLCVVAMTSNGFTLADPEDAGMMDVVGFDSSTPEVMRQFALGEL
eukprot:m.332125 g.332125  ORF g.332125 m.332125 type:complete len:561 (+) comp16882_c0_seq1:171-1853(+)